MTRARWAAPTASPHATGGRGRLAAATLALAATLAGCAPHLVRLGELVPAVRADRYRTALAGREARGAGVDAQVLLWAEFPEATRLPGAEGRLLLAGPDAFRLRVGSLFGTALDLAARGDSLSAYVPSRRQGVRLDARRDSLGLRRPGDLAFRALSAAWRPPAAAWEGATWRDTLLWVWWLEDHDTLGIAIGSEGLPARASWVRPDGDGVTVSYRGWDRSPGIAWPAVFELRDLHGAFRVTGKVSHLHFADRVQATRLAVTIPDGAEPMSLAALRRALERLGSP